MTQASAHIAIIGGGPAGLMAAEVLAGAGHTVTVYDRKPTVGRKFLMAGRGGLNLTHSEGYEAFILRYGDAAPTLSPIIKKFSPLALQEWCEGLGQETFIGSSGRIFPVSLKASPLLRAWQERLNALGVRFVLNCDWTGWDSDGALLFTDSKGNVLTIRPNASFFALGGASWPRLGSDGSWVDVFKQAGIPVSPLKPSNSGFTVSWTDIFRNRFAGTPVKPLKIDFAGRQVQGEMMITDHGVEGGIIYALSADIRRAIDAQGTATLHLDLRPGISADEILNRLKLPRGSQSLSTYLQKSGGLSPVAMHLLREVAGGKDIPDQSPETLARLIKSLPLVLTAPFSIDRAISTAGGVPFEALNDDFMVQTKPGMFIGGEMMDWEAPTGGYLLQATFATAHHAANGILKWLNSQQE